jgi:hypothetical protein
MRIVLSLAIGASLVLTGGTASAKRMQPLSPAVVCVPSGEQTPSTSFGPSFRPSGTLCLLNFAPWFSQTSVELTPKLALTPRAVPKRWGAELELRF